MAILITANQIKLGHKQNLDSQLLMAIKMKVNKAKTSHDTYILVCTCIFVVYIRVYGLKVGQTIADIKAESLKQLQQLQPKKTAAKTSQN